MKEYLIGLIGFIAYFGLISLVDNFSKKSEKFNKATNGVANALAIAWLVLLYGGAAFGVIMLLLHFVFKVF